MPRAAALASLLVTVALAGCVPTGAARRTDGQTLFSQDCGVCHSLSGSQSPRRQGGDLLAVHASRAAMLQFVQEMPVRHPLSSAQLRTIAAYVLAVEARGHQSGS
jgi:mono/diheme cytochrome c family protein